MRTGSLIQTINLNIRSVDYHVDVSERHAFVCEGDVVHVFSRESGIEILRIPAWSCPTVRCSQRLEDPLLASGDCFITPLSVSHESYKVDESLLSKFIAGVFSRTSLWLT